MDRPGVTVLVFSHPYLSTQGPKAPARRPWEFRRDAEKPSRGDLQGKGEGSTVGVLREGESTFTELLSQHIIITLLLHYYS